MMAGEGLQTGKDQLLTFIFGTLYLFTTGQTIMEHIPFMPQQSILSKETSFQRNTCMILQPIPIGTSSDCIGSIFSKIQLCHGFLQRTNFMLFKMLVCTLMAHNLEVNLNKLLRLHALWQVLLLKFLITSRLIDLYSSSKLLISLHLALDFTKDLFSLFLFQWWLIWRCYLYFCWYWSWCVRDRRCHQ